MPIEPRGVGLQPRYQLLPGLGHPIPFAHDSFAGAPSDSQVGIVMANRHILGRIVWPVDPVLHVGRPTQHLESVQTASRNPQRGEFLVVENYRDVLAEGRRRRTRIHHHIEYGTSGDTDQLGFPFAQSPVQATEHARGGARLGVLGFRSEDHPVACANSGVEGAGEQASFVAVGLRDEPQHTTDAGFIDVHATIMPEVGHE